MQPPTRSKPTIATREDELMPEKTPGPPPRIPATLKARWAGPPRGPAGPRGPSRRARTDPRRRTPRLPPPRARPARARDRAGLDRARRQPAEAAHRPARPGRARVGFPRCAARDRTRARPRSPDPRARADRRDHAAA